MEGGWGDRYIYLSFLQVLCYINHCKALGKFGFNAQSARVVMSGRRLEGVWVTSEVGVRKTDRAACEGQKTDNYQLPVRGDRQSLS